MLEEVAFSFHLGEEAVRAQGLHVALQAAADEGLLEGLLVERRAASLHPGEVVAEQLSRTASSNRW